MAVLTSEQLTMLRQAIARDRNPSWTKATINAAAQGLEDWLDANQASAVAAIDTATDPVVLPGAVKLAIAKIVFTERGR